MPRARAVALLGGVLWVLGGAPQPARAEPTGERASALRSPEAFPSWRERAVHVLVNRARVDPQAALAECPEARCAEKACYGPVAPMVWDLELNRAARFHADNLTRSGAGLQHDSPCSLRSDVGQTYPDACDGSPECACEGGAAGCGAGGCTDFGARLGLFGALRGASGENAAPNGDPADIFGLWLYEADGDSSCGWRTSNGHRFNILSPNYGAIGVGAAGNYMVQDFGAASANAPLAAGIHLPERPSAGREATFLTTWHRPRGEGASRVVVVVDGACHELGLEHGSATSGAWRGAVALGQGCRPYFFWGRDAQGEARYPATGSLLVGAGCEGLYEEGQAAAPCLGEEPSGNNADNNGGENNAPNNLNNNGDNNPNNSGENNAPNNADNNDPNNSDNNDPNNGGDNNGGNNGGAWANNGGNSGGLDQEDPGGEDGFVDDQQDGFVGDDAPQGESARGLCAVDRKSEASQGALPLGGLALLALALGRRRRGR